MNNFVLDWVDLIDGGDQVADIYSVRRLRKGYAGPCRRVRRALDGAWTDVGFTSDGICDVEHEHDWAGGSTVHLVRWYNQSAAAGVSRPAWLEASLSPGAPQTQSTDLVEANCRGDSPIVMRPESLLASVPAVAVSAQSTVTVVWFGCVGREGGFDSGLWSIHEEGVDDARTCEVDGFDRALIRDRGIYFGRSTLYSRSTGDFSMPSLIIATHALAEPWPSTASVNGADCEVHYAGGVECVGLGPPQLLGPNRVHSFIVDGSDGSAIRMMVSERNRFVRRCR